MTETLSAAGTRSSGPPLPFPAEPPFFILGAGRSGTTLLRNLLSAHPRMAVTPETHFLGMARQMTEVPLEADPPDFDAFWDGYCASRRFASLGLSADRCREILEGTPERSFRAAFAALLAAFAETTGKPRVGEKTPSHSHHAAWLLAAFPLARAVVLRRDPRAVIASHIKTPMRRAALDPRGSWVNRATRLHVLAQEARDWASLNEGPLAELEGHPRATFVTYEDLVRDPETTVRGVCAFLEEPFAPEMLENRPESAPAEAVAAPTEDWRAWSREHLARASGPVTGESLEKWREELSPVEVALIEALAGPAMRRFGYAPLASSAGRRRRAARLADLARILDAAERRARRLLRRGRGAARGTSTAS